MMPKSAWKTKRSERRAHHRSAKQAAKRKAREAYRKETPRSERISSKQTPTLSMALGWKQKFTAKFMRARAA